MDAIARPAPRGRLDQADRLFAASTYSDWVREGMRLRAEDTSIEALFESTISEPMPELVEVIRHAFSLSVSSRYQSVFTGGNRFAIEALARRYGVGFDQIQTTTGATSALGLVLKLLAGDGGQVLVETPGFDLLTWVATEAGGRVETFERSAPDFGIDIEGLGQRLTRETRALVLTNLHNPSGVRTADDDLIKIAALADRVGAFVVVDEVYADFARPGLARAAASLAPNLISVSSLTKVFGLFALKFGWICASPQLIGRLRARFPEGDTGVSKLSHAVAAHVLEEDAAFDLHWKRILSETRPIAARHLQAMNDEGLLAGAMPEFGAMAFPKVVGEDDTADLARRLLLRHKLLVVPGEYFGRPGHIRIGFGADAAALDRRLAALRVGLAELKAST